MKVFHKTMALIARIILGVTFIFSGFVKAVDPLGTAYKIQDYLDAFGMTFFKEYALFFSFALFSLEWVLGMTLLFGSWKKVCAWVATIFCSLMTLLTLLLALTNPISDCGCFGDAISLTNWQTFEKNVILLILSLLLLLYKAPLYRFFGRKMAITMLVISCLLPIFTGITSYRHLPLLDFRPYKIGTHIEDLMVVPQGAILDSVAIEYVYEKEGHRQTFNLANYPAGDTSWHFVDRTERVIRKGYVPPIHDFEIIHPEMGDITQELLDNEGYTFLWVAHKLERANRSSMPALKEIQQYAMAQGSDFYGLTSSTPEIIDEWVYEYDLTFALCSMDDITLKTMIRSNPGLILLKAGTVIGKWAFRDFDKVLEDIHKRDNSFNF